MIERLITALQALAAPPDVQLSRFPNFVVTSDELALDFDDAYRLVSDCPQVELSGVEADSLRRVDAMLADWSGEGRPDLWSDSALRSAPEWAALRERAADALRALGAPIEPPPPSSSFYIPGRAT